MTKRRPSNKKPTGVNRSLGNSLLNERERNRRSHQKSKFEGEVENAAMLDKVTKKVIDSITEESGLEEFLAKAQLAGTEFSADRENVRIVSENKSVVIPSRKDFLNNVELQAQYKDKLKIPRRPSRDRWNSIEELNLLENEVFLKWREDLAELQDVDGLSLTPFERNPEMWKELWRVVEKSDIVVQIVDARNPLLFRSQDLEDYVKEVDPAKQNLLLVNKADLLPSELVHVWAAYFREQNINAVFWSAMDELEKIDEDEEEMEKEQEPSCSSEASDVCYLRKKEDLIAMLKRMGHVTGTPGEKPLMIGMVGYPNVGKSSTINKLVGAKKVSVSATPGKTRHFQTIWVDKELCLCDCPGLVMPSFSFGRNEMFLNGIMPVDQMRDHYGPTSLLLSRVALDYLENRYSLLLPDREKPSATDLLTTLAFNRGFMSAAGIPDSSRAARLLIKDVVTGKILWVASPPNREQEDIDELMYASSVSGETKRAGAVQLQELEKRGLLLDEKTRDKQVDLGFFAGDTGSAHIRTSRGLADVHESSQTGSTASSATTELGSKKHFNKKKKEKLRRVFVGTYA